MERVLFVCVHNSARSQIAEAFFNYLAEGRAIAYSAGTQPDKYLSPDVIKVMQEVGIDITGQVPKALTPEMIEQTDKVISMGCGMEDICPASSVSTEDWEIGDPKGESMAKIREIRDEIKVKVTKLMSNSKLLKT